MYLVPRAYEGIWSQERVVSFLNQLTLPDLKKIFWFKGYQHSTINQLAHSWTIQESLYVMNPYSGMPADQYSLMLYDSKDLFFVKEEHDVELIDGAKKAPAPVWSVVRHSNFTEPTLQEFDSEHEYYAFHIQTVRTARFRIPEQFDIMILREDDESFKFVCRLHGTERTNRVYRQLMEVAH